jgi:hypothetical protein
MKTITGVDEVLFKFLAAILPFGLAGCVGGSSDSTGVTVQGDVPVAYVMHPNTITLNPTNGVPFAAGGDLMIREKSSPSAPEHNITAAITQGHGDVSDPEVSYDGKKLVFSLRCPTSNTSTVNGQAACTGHWNIWEYDMSAGSVTGGSFRRITSSTSDDVDPAYLPAGRGFVFTSNRQTKSHLNQPVGPNNSYYALDEYERQRVLNLHTMDKDGNNIQQISFNVSHDRNPVVRPNGDIMFSRWEHLGGRNQFTVFRCKPDGTDLFVLYGAHSEGNSFLHPRDMDPSGKYAGLVSTDLMPLQRTQEGGGLVFIDAANYSEQNTPASASVAAVGGQQQMTLQELNINRGLSQYGRVTTPYPLWDGTNRVLLGYAPCQVTRNGVAVSCATLTQSELATLSNQNRLLADVQASPLQDNVRPSYAIYMFDSAKQTMAIVAAPPAGFMYTDPIALQARAEPNAVDPTNVDPDLAAQNLAKIEIRSVYDTDGLGRMGDPVLAAADLPSGCTTSIAKTTPIDPMDTRPLVADLVRMKDPADPAYRCAPASFVRATRSIPPPSNSLGLRAAIGNTNFEQQQIVGYAPLEPDGSFTLVIPADTPITLSVIDSRGRSFQAHTNWIQARPGERRTCDGCHGPRRGAALNSGTIVNAMPAALVQALASQHQSGETMASTRARLDATVLSLKDDLEYTDVWADTSQPGVTARPSISIKYTGNANPADDLATAVPVNGIINYPDNIQPLWTRDRGANTCVLCHTDPAALDLRANMAGTGRLVSYEELSEGDPLLDANGQPVTQVQNGVLVIERGPALIDATASEGNAVGMARKSRLIEIMFGESLMSDAAARNAHPNPPVSAPNHATMLNAAEKRLISEWIDVGGQYYNDPFNGSSGVRTISGLNQDTFDAQVLPVLRSTCAAGCHQGVGSNEVAAGTSFTDNRFVLTGDVTGDYNAALAMISDTCSPASNYLLSYPSTVPHPTNATGQTTAILPVDSAGYTAIANWILTGCP